MRTSCNTKNHDVRIIILVNEPLIMTILLIHGIIMFPSVIILFAIHYVTHYDVFITLLTHVMLRIPAIWAYAIMTFIAYLRVSFYMTANTPAITAFLIIIKHHDFKLKTPS